MSHLFVHLLSFLAYIFKTVSLGDIKSQINSLTAALRQLLLKLQWWLNICLSFSLTFTLSWCCFFKWFWLTINKKRSRFTSPNHTNDVHDFTVLEMAYEEEQILTRLKGQWVIINHIIIKKQEAFPRGCMYLDHFSCPLMLWHMLSLMLLELNRNRCLPQIALVSAYQEAPLYQELHPHESVCVVHPESNGCHF